MTTAKLCLFMLRMLGLPIYIYYMLIKCSFEGCDLQELTNVTYKSLSLEMTQMSNKMLIWMKEMENSMFRQDGKESIFSELSVRPPHLISGFLSISSLSDTLFSVAALSHDCKSS